MSQPESISKLQREFEMQFPVAWLSALPPEQRRQAMDFYVEQRLEWELNCGSIARWSAIMLSPTIVGALPFAHWIDSAREKIEKKTEALIVSMLKEQEVRNSTDGIRPPLARG